MPHKPGHRLVVQKRGWGTHKGFYYRVVDSSSGSNIVVLKSSSKRYKRNIVDIALDSNKLYDLRPVDFEWNEKSATDGKKDIGLIAEEVVEIFPQIVNYNKDNKPESVSYDKLSVILLMEMKKLKEEIEKLKENN